MRAVGFPFAVGFGVPFAFGFPFAGFAARCGARGFAAGRLGGFFVGRVGTRCPRHYHPGISPW